jgi:DNA-binding MarR family transcriptional regulator
MNLEPLNHCLERHFSHAALTFRLDDELGTQHGLSWRDFVLLDLLDAGGGAVPGTQLARRLGLPRSHFVLQVLPLEKTGLVARTVTEGGERQVVLRAPGRRLLNEARETAAAVCEQA